MNFLASSLLSSSSYLLLQTRSKLPVPFFRTFASKVERGKVEVERGVKLYWEKHGYGPHVVLFLPGLCGSIQSNYWPVFRKMDHEKYTMIGIDPEGYGKSRPPDRNVFTDEFVLKRDARFAGDVMESLGYDRYSVVGWSNGGMTASWLTSLRKDNVMSLVACNTPMKPAERSNLVMDQIANLKNWEVKHRRDMLRIYDEEYATKILKDWRYFTKREAEKPHHFQANLMHVLTIDIPCLFIYGTHDAFMNPAEAITVFEDFGRPATLRLVRNGTHFHLDFLDEFVDIVSDFLGDQEIEQKIRSYA